MKTLFITKTKEELQKKSLHLNCILVDAPAMPVTQETECNAMMLTNVLIIHAIQMQHASIQREATIAVVTPYNNKILAT